MLVVLPILVAFSSGVSKARRKIDSNSRATLSISADGLGCSAAEVTCAEAREVVAVSGFIARRALHEARQRPSVLARYSRAHAGRPRRWRALARHPPASLLLRHR